MKIEMWTLDRIKPYEKNAKLHNAEAIKASIRDFQPDQPIVVDGDGVIIKGHGRLEAAKSLGMKEFPVIVRTDLAPQQVKACRIADNSCNKSGWDMAILNVDLADMPEIDFGKYGLEVKPVDPIDLEKKQAEKPVDQYLCPKCGFKFEVSK